MGTIVRLVTEQLTYTDIQTKKRLIRNSMHLSNAPFWSDEREKEDTLKID